jgi:hypothetical protein
MRISSATNFLNMSFFSERQLFKKIGEKTLLIRVVYMNLDHQRAHHYSLEDTNCAVLFREMVIIDCSESFEQPSRK